MNETRNHPYILFQVSPGSEHQLIFCMAITLIPSLGATTITSFSFVRRRRDIKLSVGQTSRIADRAISAKLSNFGVIINVTLLSSDV